MKLNLAKIARTVVRAAKKNPEVVLMVVGAVGGAKFAKTVAPIIVAAAVKR